MKNKTALCWSSGKDSAYALHVLRSEGKHEVATLLTTMTEGYDRVSMHGVRRGLAEEQARRMGTAELGRVFSELAANSRDLSFPGYPYGLVDADELARVRRNEKEALKALFASALAEKGSWERVRSHLSAVDAHDILDQI